MSRIRFMNNNFLESGFTYSSQQADFPAVNIFNTSRSRVWKPAGNFEIHDGNNKVYINDGTNKTVTLTNGSYTYSTLATHVQTQLNASSSNWTVVYDNALTYKFTINRTSGTAVLRKSQTANAAWDTLGFTGLVDDSSAPFVAQQQRNHTSEWVQFDLGVPQQWTFLGMLSGIDEIFSLSETATVRMRADNIDYWLGVSAIDITVPVSSLGVFKFFDDEITASYRYGRIEIIDRLNPLGPEGLELAYAYVGDHITVTATDLASGFYKELIDPSVQQQSENGALYSEVRPRYLSFGNCTIQLLTGSEQRELEQLFYDLGLRTPFFVSIDPGLDVTEDLEELTRYVIMTKPPRLQHIFRTYYNLDFEMREAF